jgi:hypothetical protein
MTQSEHGSEKWIPQNWEHYFNLCVVSLLNVLKKSDLISRWVLKQLRSARNYHFHLLHQWVVKNTKLPSAFTWKSTVKKIVLLLRVEFDVAAHPIKIWASFSPLSKAILRYTTLLYYATLHFYVKINSQENSYIVARSSWHLMGHTSPHKNMSSMHFFKRMLCVHK